jgi:hypothetical protein
MLSEFQCKWNGPTFEGHDRVAIDVRARAELSASVLLMTRRKAESLSLKILAKRVTSDWYCSVYSHLAILWGDLIGCR